jgi:hypothetical protein
MNYLRFAIAAYALLYVAIGVFLWQRAETIVGWYLVLYFLINAGVLAVGIFFEKSRYKAKHSSNEGWVKTKERFIDQHSGKTIEVQFHPETGERKYNEVDQ